MDLCAGALHPSIPAGVQQRMIQFLERLHVAANVQRSFGSIGGPWEFNLRDLLSLVPAAGAPCVLSGISIYQVSFHVKSAYSIADSSLL